MSLIDRYLHEVGRYLPGKNRQDILAEIRSHLSDTLEERCEGEPSEEDVVELLKETGSPQKLAASYPGGQHYLIGPDLYPFFRMVVLIALAAVIGAQLLALGIGIWTGEETIRPLDTLASLLMSIPSAVGSVVIVFIILQYFGVRPKLEDEPWDPRSLPEIEEEETVKRGETIFGIAAGCVILAILAVIPDKIGFITHPGGVFYPYPVIVQYIGWICLSLLAGIGLNIYLLWQGRRTTASRIAEVVVNVISIAVLGLLVQGHTAWLASHGSVGFFDAIEKFSMSTGENIQVFGMEIFRFAFTIALIVVIIETAVMIFKLIRGAFTKNPIAGLPADHS